MDLDTSPADHRVSVRALTDADLDRLTRLDKAWTGRSRREWLQARLTRAGDTGSIALCFGAEVDGSLVGALLGNVQFGEYGQPEPTAILDTLLVDQAFSGQGVGRALMEQLRRNLVALRIETVRTEVGWQEQRLIGFLAKNGFQPAPRLVLELEIG
ncbi:MAG: GNAT superfamily N-acetyltransferase [Kiritimatiellia bacterium]|jgi:GNAT superfamily N-acetyltransferase